MTTTDSTTTGSTTTGSTDAGSTATGSTTAGSTTPYSIATGSTTAGSTNGVPIDYTTAEVDGVAFNADGLVPAIVQDATDRAVLMMAWMNRESLIKTLETGRTWFWSRSRGELWCKGETSGDRQFVRSMRYDCDGDTLLVEVDQHGAGACHTGNRTCFYRAFGDAAAAP